MTFCSHTSTQSPYIYPANGSHNYREITLALVNNVDISLVSPELYPNLLPYLDQYILKFQDRNDFGSVNRLKFCKEYIDQYPERERIAKILTKRKSDPPPEPLPFNPEQLDAEIDRLLSLKKLNSSNANYSQKEINQLIVEMRNRRLEAAEDENFDLADRLALVSSQLTSQGAINQIRKIKIEQADEMKQKLDETKQTYNDLKERWGNLQANFKEETTKELNQMKEKQKKERIEFEKKKEGPIPPKYRKHTQEYLNLKQEEKMLVTSKRFDEATIIQQRVREQEKYEKQLIQKEWFEVIDRDLKKLTEKHKKQLRIREMNIKKEKDNIERTKKKELDALKNKITFLEKQITDLEQFGAPPPEKPGKSNDSTKSSNNEEKDKKSEHSYYYYSYYDSHETDDLKSKISIIKDENENKVFFTESPKSEVNRKFINEEEDINESNDNTENLESNEKMNDDQNHKEDEDKTNSKENEEEDAQDKENDENINESIEEEDENNEDTNEDESNQNDENKKENQNDEDITNDENKENIKEKENKEDNQDNEDKENEDKENEEEEDNENSKENSNNVNSQKNENDENIQDKENNENVNGNEEDKNVNDNINSPDNENIQEDVTNVIKNNENNDNCHDIRIPKNDEDNYSNQNTDINDKDDQISEILLNSPKYVVHPPEEGDGQRNGYKNRNKKGNQISNNRNENENNNHEQNNTQKKIKSSGYYANSTTSLPHLPIARKPRKARKDPSGPEAFRQRALLNKQLYCGKALLSQHIKNQKEQQKKKKKKVVDEDSM